MAVNLAEGVDLDLQTVLTGRGCAIGQSGSGKSYLAGVLVEELCRLNMPFCVIDTEGEYAALKGITSLIVAGGEHEDVDLDVDFYKLFNASVLNDIPVVLDLSDVIDKRAMAFKALQELYRLESKVRKPYLVLLEEADKFAPQVTSRTPNVIDEISVRGRKRGIGLFITTQRPANVSKNVLAQCSYGFIGKLTIENDLKAIRILLAGSRALTAVTRLHTGEFVPFGLNKDISFKVKARKVQHTGMTPAVETYKAPGSKLSNILKELKEPMPEESIEDTDGMDGKSAPSRRISIHTLHAFLATSNAREYAGRIAKRRFWLFGGRVEKVDVIDNRYLPIRLCSLRMPTGRKDEYMEYCCMLSGHNELVRIADKIRFAALSENNKPWKNYRNYLTKEAPSLDTIQVGKEELIADKSSTKKTKKWIGRFFSEAILMDVKTVYIPVYRITLRRDNKVRVFTIDALFGKKVDLQPDPQESYNPEF